MERIVDGKTNTAITSIEPGEYYSCTDGGIIVSFTGVNFCLCLGDDKFKTGGMINTLFPVNFITNQKRKAAGILDHFLHDVKMQNKSGEKWAKIFGLGNTLNFRDSDGNVHAANAVFLEEYLNRRNIKIVKTDTGGIRYRKLLFFTSKGKILVKKISSLEAGKKIIRQELEFKKQIFRS